MYILLHWRRLVLALLLLAPVGCGRVHGDDESPARPAFVLGDEEIRLARELAEADLDVPTTPHGPLERVYFVKADLMPDGQVDGSQRLVMVHHYRYRGDETIFTLVDLHRAEVVRREVQAHYPTALAAAEVLHAEKLARQDVRLKALFESGVAADARPLQFSNPNDPFFGHRVVHVMLRRQGDCLTTPRVLIDLTTDTVHLD